MATLYGTQTSTSLKQFIVQNISEHIKTHISLTPNILISNIFLNFALWSWECKKYRYDDSVIYIYIKRGDLYLQLIDNVVLSLL
jgi:hypothetical protein